MYSRLSAVVCFSRPPLKSRSRGLAVRPCAPERRPYASYQEVSCMEIVVKGAGFILADPNTDQVAGHIVALRQCVKGLSFNVFLGDLTLETGAVAAVFGHGFHPWKTRQSRLISNLQSVYSCPPGQHDGGTPSALELLGQNRSVRAHAAQAASKY